jgi:hypothetical protein
MYHGRIHIAPNYTLEECKEVFLNLKPTSDEEVWRYALRIFSDRMNARFFDAIRTLSGSCNDQWGHNLSFSIMALNCLLIETLQQFYDGLESTPARKNEAAFKRFLSHSNYFGFSRKVSEQFYRNIRCGILHQAETKGNVALSFSDDEPIVEERDSGWIVFNVKKVSESLFREFDSYLDKLYEPTETKLRSHFILKMRFIVMKADSENIFTL